MLNIIGLHLIPSLRGEDELLFVLGCIRQCELNSDDWHGYAIFPISLVERADMWWDAQGDWGSMVCVHPWCVTCAVGVGVCVVGV